MASQEALTLPANTLIGKSPEEDDHLERSTKKIKDKVVATEDQEMVETQPPLEEQRSKSFKQALTATKLNEKAFDNDLDRLSCDDELLTDEEDNEEIEEMDDVIHERDLGIAIPKIKLPSRLIRFAIGKYTYTIEYEHLHYFCFTCGKVGHRKEYCSTKPTPAPARTDLGTNSNGPIGQQRRDTTANSPTTTGTIDKEQVGTEYGPWMLVNRKHRRPTAYGRQPGPNNSRRPNNRFGPLGDNPSNTSDRPRGKGKSVDPDHYKKDFLNKASSSDSHVQRVGEKEYIENSIASEKA
ncbi:hypothetical protein LOK49_LG13G00282 [Camellia lanceoleosa]|uniref:Uncharacterized protein n=1 Tax=Camellia lanceoleosa TaxID=1840588 RepID=A0ACC0FH01_9ERIC|nr:hypothetical protein LOK49_LG13G00282 [Camellia lanceoleosa]